MRLASSLLIAFESITKNLFLFGSQVFIVETVKISAEITDWKLAVSVISQFRLVHVKFLTADKAGFNFFFAHAMTLKKK